jgi:hypothetical protein
MEWTKTRRAVWEDCLGADEVEENFKFSISYKNLYRLRNRHFTETNFLITWVWYGTKLYCLRIGTEVFQLNWTITYRLYLSVPVTQDISIDLKFRR